MPAISSPRRRIRCSIRSRRASYRIATSRERARFAATTDARGDQCDNCGNTLDPTDLINPRSKLTQATPELRQTEHFFFDLPQFSERLIAWIETHDNWRPNVRRFTENWVREGLKPRAITRDLDWGVPIPVPGFEEKRIYVWFDAVIGYLSASIEWASATGHTGGVAAVVGAG